MPWAATAASCVDDAALGQRVLAGGGLVGDHDPGAEQQRLGQDDPLLLAAGELVRVAAEQGFAVGSWARQGAQDARRGRPPGARRAGRSAPGRGRCR